MAFTNTNGGTIFLGITDNGQIKECKVDNDRIVNLITAYCDPPIEIQVDSVSLEKKTITLVKVPEGRNKPYILKDRGIFVRRGATDRQIQRIELDDIYNQKQSTGIR